MVLMVTVVVTVVVGISGVPRGWFGGSTPAPEVPKISMESSIA